MTDRRDFLKSTVLLTALMAGADRAFATEPAQTTRPFDLAWLKGQARALASRPFRPAPKVVHQRLIDMGYDEYQHLRFRREQALWGKEDRGFRVEFFHMGRGFTEPVTIHEIVDGQARDVKFNPNMFDYSKSGISPGGVTKGLAFAGFRLHSATDWQRDVAAFLGASYFRAISTDTRQFGLSARGLAIDTAMNRAEEFPRFTSFWFERPANNSRNLVLYALMDSESATGAYRFDIVPGTPHVMDVDAAIYPRKAIERLGIAPLTSMYQTGENDRRMANDWRPEIHDSDGLSMLTGNGEWIWRPIANPANLRVNSYFDRNPRGFGLLQRDRDFAHYQDDGVFYERRPSLWIEPKGQWGAGAVQLVEIPTIDETFDNIVAYWNPTTKPKAGDELLYGYRMYWCTQLPAYMPLAQAVATRTGLGGVVGQKRQHFSWRFAIDFAGGELATLPTDGTVEPIITASRGAVEIASARPLSSVQGYRAMFDLRPLDDSTDAIDLRLFLRLNGQPLSETWIYQWNPPSPTERKGIMAHAGS
jgi:periplasmic glucans biosynthesis protein